MIECDVAVVGAGPAGSTAARLLAANGATTIVLERSRLPRYKSCGGGIPMRTSRRLPFPIDSIVEDRISRLELTYRGGRRIVQRSAVPFAAMVMRDRFDQLLAEHAMAAGAKVVDGVTVRSLTRVNDAIQVATDGEDVRAGFVIGADGANSVVARDSGLGAGLERAVALQAEIGAPAAMLERWRGSVNVDVGYLPAGYGWVFPKARLLSIGLVRPRGFSASVRTELAAYLLGLELAGATAERIAGHQVLFRRGSERIAGDRVLLAGDAAGLVDEFTEEGIFYAIQSGELAARFVGRALAGGHHWLGAYQHAVDREIMPELRAARVIARLYYGTLARAPRIMHGLSRSLDYLWSAFFRIQGGDSSYDAELRRARMVPPLARLLLRGST